MNAKDQVASFGKLTVSVYFTEEYKSKILAFLCCHILTYRKFNHSRINHYCPNSQEGACSQCSALSNTSLQCIRYRLANRPGMAGIVPELTHGVPCLRRGSFCPGNVKIDHRVWIYGCSLVRVLYFVLYLSVTHDLT